MKRFQHLIAAQADVPDTIRWAISTSHGVIQLRANGVIVITIDKDGRALVPSRVLAEGVARRISLDLEWLC